jgi:hypothetical protein
MAGYPKPKARVSGLAAGRVPATKNYPKGGGESNLIVREKPGKSCGSANKAF